MLQLIKYWRAKAIRVVIYIDDGIGGAGTFENAVIISQQVKSDLVGCGFTLNKKSVWTPTQLLPWSGHILNFKTGIIAITEEKINKLKQSPGISFYSGADYCYVFGHWELGSIDDTFNVLLYFSKKELVFYSCTKPRCSKRIKFLVGQSRPV